MSGIAAAIAMGASLVAVPVLAQPDAAVPAGAGSAAPAAALSCDMSGYLPSGGVAARLSEETLILEWRGTPPERLRLALGIEAGVPMMRALELREGDGAWATVVRDAAIEYRVVEGFRRISNQQLRPLRDLGVEITPEVVDRHKWDVFWDAPLDLSEETSGGNPPPAGGVANQPGLPRSPDEVRRGEAAFDVGSCAVASDGTRLTVTFPGVTLGSFSGDLVLTVFEGTNLIRSEIVAATDLPSVAYKYDMGLVGLGGPDGPDGDGPDGAGFSGGAGGVEEPDDGGSEAARVHWRDLSGRMQSYGLTGPSNADPVTLRAQNRLVVAETNGGAVAAFPPPHTFFWAREVEIVVGNNWYRKDDDGSFGIGIRQGEGEVVERYRANWSLYSAPPGTEQRMAGFFYPTLGPPSDAFDAALAFTNGDVYRPLPGYQVMGSHYHTNVGRELMASGSVDTRLEDFSALRGAGIDIAGPVDRPRDETQLEELHWLFEGARRHSDDTFVVMPQMENSNLLGGHWDLLFSHPVYYVDERAPGTPLVTEHPEYGRMYNIGSAEDVMAMVEAEDMLVYMPHPRTKGSTGYPDAVRDTPHFLHDRYRGAGWRWGMGSDLSEERLSGKRVIPLLDDMNNWIAGTSLRPKYLLGITETYFKAPGDDIYANGPVSYIRLDDLPTGGDYAPIVDALMAGDYFVSSGEVLIPSHSVEVSAGGGTLTAEVEWTFPLDFVEVVTGDGSETTTVRVSATDRPPFGRHTFEIPFEAGGQAWVRFAAWDAAGNGAMTMPVSLDGR